MKTGIKGENVFDIIWARSRTNYIKWNIARGKLWKLTYFRFLKIQR